jgi:hypothetical protein
VTVPRRNFVRGAGHADRRRYAPAYKGDGSMLYPQGNSARNNPDDIPSAKATKGSVLKTAQRLSQQPPAFEDRAVAFMMSVVGIVGFMLAVVSPTIASAATIEEVAHCRAIPQLAERLNCFKSLKPGPRPKTEDVAPGKKQQAGSSKVKNAERPKARQAAPAKAEQPAPAKTEQAAPVKMEQEAPAKTEQAAPAKAEQAAPAKAEQAASAKAEQPAPSNTQTTTQSNAGEALISPTPDDPATTVSIDHLSFAPGQPICVDQYALAGTILAGLLTSDPTTAATRGCQTIPDDAKLERLERFPSVFSFMRTIRVKVTSPTQPDLTSGFTIEMGR